MKSLMRDSIILHGTAVSEADLQLLIAIFFPRLKISLTFAIFHSTGRDNSARDLKNIWASRLQRTSVYIISTWVCIMSIPGDLSPIKSFSFAKNFSVVISCWFSNDGLGSARLGKDLLFNNKVEEVIQFTAYHSFVSGKVSTFVLNYSDWFSISQTFELDDETLFCTGIPFSVHLISGILNISYYNDSRVGYGSKETSSSFNWFRIWIVTKKWRPKNATN